MSTTTLTPDGHLSMNPNDTKSNPRKPSESVHIVAVSNGWMLYAEDHYLPGTRQFPTYVFNNIDEMLRQVKELLAPGSSLTLTPALPVGLS